MSDGLEAGADQEVSGALRMSEAMQCPPLLPPPLAFVPASLCEAAQGTIG